MANAPRKIPVWRKLVRIAMILAAVAAAGFAAVTTRWFQDYLRRQVTASLETVTGGKVQLAGFHFRPLRFEVDVERATIRGKEAAEEPPLFEARQVEARLEPELFFHFQARLRRFSWASAAIRVRTMPDGTTNIPGPAAPSSGLAETLSGLMNLSVRSVRLADTEITWNQKPLPVAVRASNLTLVLRAAAGHEYKGSVAASPIELRGGFGAIPAARVDSRFTLSPRALDVDSLDWRTGGLAGSAGAEVGWSPAVRANFHFSVSGPMAETLRALKVEAVRQGRVEIAGEGKYSGGWSVRGRAAAQDLDVRLRGLRPLAADFSADYGLEDGKVRLTRMRAGVFQGSVEGSATGELRDETPEWKFSGAVKGVEIAAMLASLAGSHSTLALLHPAAAASGGLEASWRGLFEGLRANFDVGLSAPKKGAAKELPIAGRVAGEAEYGGASLLTIKSANLTTPHSKIQAEGKIGAQSLALQAAVETTSFEEWRPLIEFYTETSSPIALGLEEPARFTGTISGSLDSPAVDGRLEAGRFEYQGWKWDGFQAGVKLGPEGASVAGARLWRGSSVLKIDAAASLDHWKFGPESTVHLALSASHSPIEALRAALGIERRVTGLLSGELSLDGTRSNLGGDGRVEISEGRINGVGFDEASARLEISHSAWNLKDVAVRKGRASATGSARIDFPNRTFTAGLRGERLELADVFSPAGKEHGKSRKPVVRGVASFDLEAQGAFDHPEGTLSAKLDDLRIYGTAIGRAEAAARIQGKALDVSLTAEGAGGEIKLSGKGEAGGGWPVSVSGSFSKVRLDPWIELVAQDQPEPPAVMSGYFSLAGPLAEPSRMEGHAAAESLEIDFPNLTLRNDIPVEISYLPPTLKIGAIRLRGPGTNVNAAGSVNFEGAPTVSFDATGEADAALLRLVDPKLLASGHSDLKLHVTGRLAAPRVQGALTVSDVNVGYGDLPFRVNGLNGSVELEGDKAVITSMSGTVGAGRVDFSGSVTLGRLPRYEIRVGVQEIRIRYPADFTSVLDGRLVLEGNKDRGRLGGELAVRNVFVSQNLDIFNLAAPGTNAPEAAAVSSPLASLIGLSVRVISSPSVQIETRNVRLVADVDLRVQGTLAEPVVMGAIRARSGNAVFRGNRYAITRGEIDFNNPFRTEPALDLEAQTRVQSYDLAVQVSGPFDRLRFSYRSDPPLPTEDILSLLAFGYAQRYQGMGTASGRSFSSVGASALLSEALSSQLSGRIQELFGVSRIKIDPNLGDPGEGAGPRLTVEQQLSPDLTLTYTTSTANSQYRVVQFEWDVRQDVSVIGTRDQNGIFGLELRFRRRFK